jgi:AraC-like DNA-binding protein
VALDYREREPPPALTDFIECLWRVEGRSKRDIQRVVPDGCPELIIHLGDPFERRIGNGWRRQARAFLAGTLVEPWILRPGLEVATFGARFRPGAVRSVLPIDMSTAVAREVTLERILGRRVSRQLQRELQRVLAAGADPWRAFGSWLVERAGEVSTRGERPTTGPAVRAILDSGGAIPLVELRAALDWTPRQLQRAFTRDLGVSAKFFARIVRLNRLFLTLEESDRQAGVDLALELGYYDQPHMLLDTRRLAGRKPSTPRLADGDLAKHFTDPVRLKRLLRTAL